MRRFRTGTLVLAFVAIGVVPALAQGPTTGSINGTVSDNTGAVLPGVTVTATSPAMMGTQAAVSNEQGQYRFPAVTPGTYRLSYELPGFTTIVREGIVVNLGFTATVNVQLTIASLQETVTVSGASPVVDVQNTNVQNNFTAEMLKNIPNARDIWSLIAEAPGMTVTRFDVGGSTAGTQTGFQAYGLGGQVRVQIDGVNTTEGTGAAGFYFDYGSFDEIQLGIDSNDASMPSPGVQLNAVLKSGGNQFKGELYLDYENESLQGRNVDDRLRRLGVGEGTRITKYYDPNVSIGGPIKRDKIWYFVSLRNQFIGTTVTGFPVEDPGSGFEFTTKLQNLSYKVTYQLNQNNKIGTYLQFGRKLQPHRDASSTRYQDAVYMQDSNSWAANLEWNSIVSPQFFHNARFSTFGYRWPNIPYGPGLTLNENVQVRRLESATSNQSGGAYNFRYDRTRYQFDWAGTLFKDNWLGGNHAIKTGYLSEWEEFEDWEEGYQDSIRLRFNSPAGAPDFTTPQRVELRNTPVVAIDRLWHHGAYVQDQIQVGRKLTLNAGVRWDYYSAYYPGQTIRESPFRDFFYAGKPLPNGFSIPASYPDFKVPGLTGLAWKAAIAPRAGLAWDLQGSGKTVLKASWGRYFNNPGTITTNIDPIQETVYTFAWNDVIRDRQFQIQNELGTFVSSSGGAQNTIDPNIGQPYTDDMSVWVEREIVPNVSGRVGFVYKRRQNGTENVELARVGSLFTERKAFADAGPDGIAGNADDGPSFTLFDVPASVPLPPSRTQLQSPDENDSDYKSIDFTVNKRMTNRWSLVASFLYTWNHESLYGHPDNPNQELYNFYDSTLWAFKAFGTYRAPYGFAVSPVLRHQAGDPLSRVVRVTTLRYTSEFDSRAEPVGAYREDNVTIFDTRVEKRIPIWGSRELGLFFDAFNIFNSNAAQAQDNLIGRRTVTLEGQRIEYQRFLRPTTIIGPRVYRLGFKLSF